jgi:hypothetical protein
MSIKIMEKSVYRCQNSGKVAFIWRDGLFPTIYCVCGIKIIVSEDSYRTGKNRDLTFVPEHNTRRLNGTL